MESEYLAHCQPEDGLSVEVATRMTFKLPGDSCRLPVHAVVVLVHHFRVWGRWGWATQAWSASGAHSLTDSVGARVSPGAVEEQ